MTDPLTMGCIVVRGCPYFNTTGLPLLKMRQQINTDCPCLVSPSLALVLTEIWGDHHLSLLEIGRNCQDLNTDDGVFQGSAAAADMLDIQVAHASGHCQARKPHILAHAEHLAERGHW